MTALGLLAHAFAGCPLLPSIWVPSATEWMDLARFFSDKPRATIESPGGAGGLFCFILPIAPIDGNAKSK
jgi:hypothetical protein